MFCSVEVVEISTAFVALAEGKRDRSDGLSIVDEVKFVSEILEAISAASFAFRKISRGNTPQ